MGTRGFITFVAEGVEKTTYNHSDSYPAGLGLWVLADLREFASTGDLDGLRDKAIKLRVVPEGSTPSAEDIARFAPQADLSVSDRSLNDWYCLLRNTQGSASAILDAGVLIDDREFPLDSVMAEYGYVIDTDAGCFEAYKGFQKEQHDKGRFADRKLDGKWYPVALVASWPLTNPPSDDEFMAAFDADKDGE